MWLGEELANDLMVLAASASAVARDWVVIRGACQNLGFWGRILICW